MRQGRKKKGWVGKGFLKQGDELFQAPDKGKGVDENRLVEAAKGSITLDKGGGVEWAEKMRETG